MTDKSQNLFDELTAKRQIITGKNGDYHIIQNKGRFYLYKDGKQYGLDSFDEITYNPYNRFLICRNGIDHDYYFIDRDHGYSDQHRDWYDVVDGYTRSFSSNGKVGLKKGKRVILPELFDEVDKWSDCDVLYTRLGMDVRYFDLVGNEILKKRRDLGDAEDHLYPYYHDAEISNGIVQTMDFRAQPDGEDFCVCHGQKVGLSRRTIAEHATWLRQMSNIAPCPKKMFLEARISSYLESYIVQSRPGVNNPLNDCLLQLLATHLIESWNVSFTILVPESTKNELTESEIHTIKRLDYMNRDNDFRGITVEEISKGTTASISEGVILIVTRYFVDCYPICKLRGDDEGGKKDIEQNLSLCEDCPHHCWRNK